jgi:hypothetical protein
VIWSLVRCTLRLPVFSYPFLVAQIGPYLPGRCKSMQRKLFLHSQCRTSISDYAFPKPSPWPDSGRMNCSETTKALVFAEFSASPYQETGFRTGWREGFLSRREFHSLYNPWSELHPLIFAEQFWGGIYHSIHDWKPIRYTATVNDFTNHHAGYKQL